MLVEGKEQIRSVESVCSRRGPHAQHDRPRLTQVEMNNTYVSDHTEDPNRAARRDRSWERVIGKERMEERDSARELQE